MAIINSELRRNATCTTNLGSPPDSRHDPKAALYNKPKLNTSPDFFLGVPLALHEAPSREGRPENYQQLTINLHLNRTRQYGQSIVNAILYKPFEQGGFALSQDFFFSPLEFYSLFLFFFRPTP